MEQQKLPNSTLILIFGILSIFTCCCYGVLGLILGITTLILASKATKLHKLDPEAYTGYSNVTIGKVLAIIGIVLPLLYLIFTIWSITTFGFETMQDKELFQQELREYFEN